MKTRPKNIREKWPAWWMWLLAPVNSVVNSVFFLVLMVFYVPMYVAYKVVRWATTPSSKMKDGP